MKNFGRKISMYSALLTFFLLTMFVNVSKAMDPEEAQAYSNFITTLIYDIEFDRKGNFCILGNDDIAKDLSIKFPNALKLEENTFSNNYTSCSAIYISQGSERGLRVELEKITQSKIVTIAIFEGFTNIGGTLQIQIGRRNFEIIASSKLLKTSGAKLGVLTTNLTIN